MRLIFISLAFSFISCTPKGFVSVSKDVEEKCISPRNKWKGRSFHSLRVRLYDEGKLDFINSALDTLYMLETYEVESGTYAGRIWNSKNAINYTFVNNKFTFDKQDRFTAYTVRLVQNWDTAAIRKEESMNANMLPENYVNGTRVFIERTRAVVECVKFKEFFSLERDR